MGRESGWRRLEGGIGGRRGRAGRFLLFVALFILLGIAPVPDGSLWTEADAEQTPGVDDVERQAGPDLQGPSIRDVRANPPLAGPGEVVSLGATITDPTGVGGAWVRIEGPGVGLNVTLVGFGDMWFLNRSWDMIGAYAFEIGAQDTIGNVNTATGSFQVRESLADTFGLVVLLGTLLGVGGGALAFLWYRRRGPPSS